MALFRRPKVTRDDLVELREWVGLHDGVEAYVEPRTSMSPTTVVLVAGDGEFTRRPISSPQVAAAFARSAGIPVYDTNRIGLPQRMRDFAVRQQNGQKPSPGRSPREMDAITLLADAAVLPVPRPDSTFDELRSLLRSARGKAHPDRNSGDRSAWDAVEDAAQALGLD